MCSPLMLLALCILLPSAANALLQENCEEEIARENAEDERIHECRTCQPLEVDATANCPPKGYHCDTTLRMRTNVLSAGGRDCLQIRCADANATLAVGKRLVTKVTCAGKEWHSSKQDIAASGVCARKCGVGICQTLPAKFFTSNPTLHSFEVNAPDASHPCAWGSCPDGALAGDSTSDQLTADFPGTVIFSCTGDGKWSLPEGNLLAFVACKEKANPNCTPLSAATPAQCVPLTPSGPPQCSQTVKATVTTATMNCGAAKIRILTDIGGGKYSWISKHVTIECKVDGWYEERTGGSVVKLDLTPYTDPIVGCEP